VKPTLEWFKDWPTVEPCKHPQVYPDGMCASCGVLATLFPGLTAPTHVMIPSHKGAK